MCLINRFALMCIDRPMDRAYSTFTVASFPIKSYSQRLTKLFYL